MKKYFLITVLAVLLCASCSQTKEDEKDSMTDGIPVETPAVDESIHEEDQVEPAPTLKLSVEEEKKPEPAPEIYAEIIEGLNEEQRYALADLGLSEKCLIVAEAPYVEYFGIDAAMTAEIYGLDSSGSIVDFGQVQTNGSGYLLAVEPPYLYVSGGHHIELMVPNVETGELDITEGARIEFGESTDTYFYTKDGVESEVQDDTEFNALFERYDEKAQIIDFIKR